MRLIDEKRRLRERGRIRIGYSTTNERGKKIPHKLDVFRFTSPDRQTIAQVASVYGGEVEPWTDGGRNQWQVTTEAKELAVLFITGGVAFSQSREQWQGGHLVRICDGETAYVPQAKGRFKEEACICDSDGEPLCSLTTHLGLVVTHLPGLGLWRLVTHGYNAAAELAGSVDLIEGALGAGLQRVAARLLIEVREARRIVDDRAIVRKFAVPVLELDTSVAALGTLPPSHLPSAVVGAGEAPAALPAGKPAGWAPVDQEALPEAPERPSFAEQVAGVDAPKPRRKNTAPALPPTGLPPRSAADVEDRKLCAACRESLANEPAVRNPDGPGFIHRRCAGSSGSDAVADRPAVEAQASGGGGTSRSVGSSGATEPSPAGRAAPGYSPGLSAAQHKKCFALMAEAFPAWENATGPEVDAYRKAAQLGIARWAGAPADIASRNDIPRKIADPLIKALEKLVAGEWVWNGEALYDAEDGSAITFTEVDW